MKRTKLGLEVEAGLKECVEYEKGKKKLRTRKLTVSFDDYRMKSLKEPEFAACYLDTVLEDNDPRRLIIALKHVADAQGGLTKIARRSKIRREHLHRLLSFRGNPTFFGINTVLTALGFKLSISTLTR